MTKSVVYSSVKILEDKSLLFFFVKQDTDENGNHRVPPDGHIFVFSPINTKDYIKRQIHHDLVNMGWPEIADDHWAIVHRHVDKHHTSDVVASHQAKLDSARAAEIVRAKRVADRIAARGAEVK